MRNLTDNSGDLDVDIDEDAVETAEEQADKIGVNDIDDETPTASDNDDDDVIWSRCGLRSIIDIGVHSSRERVVCFCANSANQKSFLGTYVLARHSGKPAVYPITRSSQWSDLLITDSGSSLPLPTTKNSGDWSMRRCSACSRHLERKTTRNMAHITWCVRLQSAQRCANC